MRWSNISNRSCMPALCLLCNTFIQFEYSFTKMVRKWFILQPLDTEFTLHSAYMGFWSTHHSPFCSKKSLQSKTQSFWEGGFPKTQRNCSFSGYCRLVQLQVGEVWIFLKLFRSWNIVKIPSSCSVLPEQEYGIAESLAIFGLFGECYFAKGLGTGKVRKA